jgi:hypothetical protein
MDGKTAPGGMPLSVVQVADLLDTVAAADLLLAEEMDRIECSRRPVSDETVRRLEDLLCGTLRPAVAARGVLAEVARAQPDLIRTAVGMWRQRMEGGSW